jgi:hypothetical protein
MEDQVGALGLGINAITWWNGLSIDHAGAWARWPPLRRGLERRRRRTLRITGSDPATRRLVRGSGCLRSHTLSNSR